jgi:hypothetical protein
MRFLARKDTIWQPRAEAESCIKLNKETREVKINKKARAILYIRTLAARACAGWSLKRLLFEDFIQMHCCRVYFREIKISQNTKYVFKNGCANFHTAFTTYFCIIVQEKRLLCTHSSKTGTDVMII